MADVEIDGRAMDGNIEVGEYGFSSTLKNEEGETSFNRERQHAEMMPFYYRLWCPKNQHFAGIVLQNIGVYGCKGALDALLIDSFREQFPGYILEIREAISRSMIEHYVKKGSVKEFSFISSGVPKDWADGYGGLPLDDKEAEIEVRIRAKRGTTVPWPKRLAQHITSKGAVPGKLFELNKFHCENFRVKLEIDGQTKTLSQVEFFNMSSRLDVSADLKKDAEGKPLRSSIRSAAISQLKKLSEEIEAQP